MKKKGLIISTVVMVVVLIASLTTATYAWFSSSAAATVSNISLNVGAASQVQIGVGTGTAATGYHYGDVTFASDAWTGSNQGLGTSINTNLLMDVTAGVGSGTVEGDTKTMDATYNATNKLLKGSRGESDTTGFDVTKLTGVTEAVINGAGQTGEAAGKTDVVDLAMGIKIAQADVYGTYCKITVKPDGQFVGMAAALRFEIKVGEKTWAGDLLGDYGLGTGNGVKFDTTATEDGYTFYFIINDVKAAEQLEGETEAKVHAYAFGDKADITEFSIRFFIFGYDSDCCNDATGTGATISLEFAGFTTYTTDATLGTEVAGAGTKLVLA